MVMPKSIAIQGRRIGSNYPPFLVAELSGNHQQQLDLAKQLIEKAAWAGADAVKLQTYTPDTITLKSRTVPFQIQSGLWAGQFLHQLYGKAMTPWEWHGELADFAHELGLILFSTPFDESAVDFLEKEVAPPIYKVSSFELNHIPLLRRVGETGKPVFLSTGMATVREIRTACLTLQSAGCGDIVLLKCISNYPADPKDFNLRSLSTLRSIFDTQVGLSDHYLGNEIALGAVALGASVIEKHLTLSRKSGAVDSVFSLEPDEFREMSKSIETLHNALGQTKLEPVSQEKSELRFRRSIFVADSILKGEEFDTANLRIVRPADGMAPILWDSVLGRKSACDLPPGTPLRKEHVVF